MLLGCIADDLTGATDLGVTLAREGLSVIQANGVPAAGIAIPPADAVVVALKSRTSEPDEAIAQALSAVAWLRARGAERIYFKYCSTFDSTPRGNIGPVTEALQEALGVVPGDLPTPATPAYPRNGRTVYLGHLFVGDVLLSDSGMRTHPLTPMTDSNLVRVLPAYACSSSRVARHPARLSRRLACARWRSARRSIRACRGHSRSAASLTGWR